MYVCARVCKVILMNKNSRNKTHLNVTIKLLDCHFFHQHKTRVTSAVVSRHVHFKSPPSIRDSSGIRLSQVFVSIVKPLRDASCPRQKLPCLLLLIPSGGSRVARDRFICTAHTVSLH